DRDAGHALERLDQPVIARTRLRGDRLHAARVVDVVDPGNELALVGPRLVDEHHVWRRVVLLEPLARRAGKDRGGEGTEGLAVLDPLVQDVLDVLPARVGDDRAMAQRARAVLHPALEPADDVALGDALGNVW